MALCSALTGPGWGHGLASPPQREQALHRRAVEAAPSTRECFGSTVLCWDPLRAWSPLLISRGTDYAYSCRHTLRVCHSEFGEFEFLDPIEKNHYF